MGSIDREQIAADWAKLGLSCDLWIDSPGQRWEDFTHTTDELIIVLESRMEFEVAWRVCHAEVGEEPLIPAGAVAVPVHLEDRERYTASFNKVELHEDGEWWDVSH